MSAIWTPAQARRELENVFTERQADVLTRLYEEHYSHLVRVGDFTELKLIVKGLAAAQERTEARVEELAVMQQRLAEAQERTEARVGELAAAQQRTEARVGELAAAQQRTEARMEAMAAAIQRLAEAHQEMREEMREVRRELGGLATTVGYQLEDEAFRGLPALLARDYGLTVEGRLCRAYVTDAQGRSLEVNILGTARRNGEEVTIVGESKAQLSKNKVDEFIARRLHPLQGIFAKIFPVLVTYMISEPDAEAYAREAGIAVYYSYDF